MARLIDQIRQSEVSAQVMRSAVVGALELPPAEMLEILVYLTTKDMWRDQAQLTLAGWNEESALAVVQDPKAPVEVLRYFANPRNKRPRLLQAVLENPSLPVPALVELTQPPSRVMFEVLLASPRARRCPEVLHALAKDPKITPDDLERINAALAEINQALEDDVTEYEREHAAEIIANSQTAFQLVEASPEEHAEVAKTDPAAQAEPERITPLQRIARMTVGERVQLAMKGNRDDRSILIRDGVKLVALAVLESPKVTETEAESFASMKNILEDVLRAISRKRKYMKQYGVVRALVNNPRTPPDVAIPLISHLLAIDLRHLSINKNVNDMVRKIALKQLREKATANK